MPLPTNRNPSSVGNGVDGRSRRRASDRRSRHRTAPSSSPPATVTAEAITSDTIFDGFLVTGTATRGTGEAIRRFQVPVTIIRKVSEGRPNILDYLIDGRVHLIINTPSGKAPKKDEVSIRATAVARGVPLVTTIEGAETFVEAIRELRATRLVTVLPLQEYHRAIAPR